jgi:ferrous iron transport protein B
MYLLGVLVAVLSGFVFRRTIFKRSEQLPFVMELPPFRRPSLSTIGRQVWDRTMGFVRSVWTVIVAASVIVWLLLNIPYRDGQPPALSDSLFGGVSRAIAPVFEPAGFGNWQASGSLVTGLVAKEVVISTMGQVYGVEAPDTEDAPAASHTFLGDLTEIASGFVQATLDTLKATASLLPGVNLMDDEAGTGDDQTALQAALHDHFTPLQAVAFSVFVLLYTPCMATVGAIRHEFGSRWMWFSMVYMLSVAWIAAVLTYQAGSLLGLG